jgi:FMN-dependent dehydrogenase
MSLAVFVHMHCSSSRSSLQHIVGDVCVISWQTDPSSQRHSARVQVFVDGGIKRGSDVFKALAIGAKAVGIGRAALFGLAAYGQPGVEKALEILQDELYTTMQMCGAPSLKDIDAEMVQGTEHVHLWTWDTTRNNVPPIKLG